MFSNQKTAIKTPKFYCEKCHYGTSKKSSYDDHLLTRKHKKAIIVNENLPKICQQYICTFCNKIYKDNSGLWRHKRKCNQNSVENQPSIDKELLTMFIKDNVEMKQMMMKIIQNVSCNNLYFTNNNVTNTVTNTNCNNSFNINVFLNETCKDAMNINEFIDSIQINLDDLENTGRKGYIEGISNIILKNLNDLEYHMRPLHCSDVKREIMYVKNNDKWEKESENKPIITNAIKSVAIQNIKQIQYWKDSHPGCASYDSRNNDLYLKIVSNSMNGLTEEEGKRNINKIISNLAKEVLIDKRIY
jgi:hypothetical protein